MVGFSLFFFFCLKKKQKDFVTMVGMFYMDSMTSQILTNASANTHVSGGAETRMVGSTVAARQEPVATVERRGMAAKGPRLSRLV